MTIQRPLPQDYEAAIRHNFSGLRVTPTFQGTVTVSTNSATLIDDSQTTNGYGVRRLTITNTDDTNPIGIRFILAGETATGHAITDCKQILAGQTWEKIVGSNMRVVAVSTGGDVAASVLVEDFI